MKLKKTLFTGFAALAMGFSAYSQAENTFPACVSTPPVLFEGTVVDAALATPELSTLVDAVVAAGLVGALSEANNITVYAPTNDAFAALPPGLLDAALNDADLLTTILTYHVTPSIQDPRRWITPRRAGTLAGASVFYHWRGGHARVNQSAVNCEAVRTDNGVVYLIDNVLLP